MVKEEEDDEKEDEVEKEEEDDGAATFPQACPEATPATVDIVVVIATGGALPRLGVGFGPGTRVGTQGAGGREARIAPTGTAARPGMQMADLLPSLPEASTPSFLHSRPPLLPSFPSAPSSLPAPSPTPLRPTPHDGRPRHEILLKLLHPVKCLEGGATGGGWNGGGREREKKN